jgi:BRCA1-associated protein
VGCGRYSHRHAAQHYDDSSHPYSLELATLRIWDYASGEFVQRGDLLECPSVQQRAVDGGQRGALIGIGSEHSSTSLDQAVFARSGDHHDEHNTTMGQSFQQSFQSLDKESPKKANMIGEEYEALLQSALEDQAQHYEGEITRLRAELTAENVDAQAMTKEEAKEIDELKGDVARFRTEIERLSRQLVDAQAQEAGYRADSQRLLREQSVAKDLLDKIKEESARENMEGQMQVDELEQQVADLTANLRMRRQFSQDGELSNAQIFGTTGASPSKSTKRGKKIRRMFRK